MHNNGKEKITLSDENGISYYSSEIGFSFIELGKMWKEGCANKSSFQVDVFDYDSQPDFDQQGFLSKDLKVVSEVRKKLSFYVVKKQIFSKLFIASHTKPRNYQLSWR